MPPLTKRAKQAAKATKSSLVAKRKITEKATKGNSIVAERRQSTEESQAALQGSFLSLGSFSSVSITCLCDKCSDGNARRDGLITKGLFSAGNPLSKKAAKLTELRLHGVNPPEGMESKGTTAWANSEIKKLVDSAYYLTPGQGRATLAAAGQALFATALEPAAPAVAVATAAEVPEQRTPDGSLDGDDEDDDGAESPERFPYVAKQSKKKKSFSPEWRRLRESATPQEERELRRDRKARLVKESNARALVGRGIAVPPLRSVQYNREEETRLRMEVAREEERRRKVKAIKSILFAKAVYFDEYENANYMDKVMGTTLTEAEYRAVVENVYMASNVVVEEHCKEGRKLVDDVYNVLRRHAHGCWREYWPLFAHIDPSVRVLQTDTCWCTAGNSAPHGTTHTDDSLTGIPIEITHVSKQKDPEGKLAETGRAIMGFPSSSGAMDAAASAEQHERIASRWEGRRCFVCKDGDVKSKHVSGVRGCETWEETRCHCHCIKNARKSLQSKGMSGAPCPRGCGGEFCAHKHDHGTKACGNIPGARCSKAFANKAYARIYEVLRRAVFRYLPEWRAEGADLPNDIGSEERGALGRDATKWAAHQLYAMIHHFMGNHEHCDHGELPKDHPTFCCKAQIAYFAKVVESIVKKLPELLTPFGLLDINMTESDHAIYRRWRPKGRKSPAVFEFLGTNLGFLQTSQLAMGFWDGRPAAEKRQHTLHIIDVLNDVHKLGIEVSGEEVAHLHRDLESRIRRKELRSSERWQRVRKEYVAFRRTSQASQRQSSYMNGGSADALEADLVVDIPAANESDYLGGQFIGIHKDADGALEALDHEVAEVEDDDHEAAGVESDGEV